jgi:dihydropteroate synthase
LFALSQGASILRVHDVAETLQGVRMWQAMAGCGNTALLTGGLAA